MKFVMSRKIFPASYFKYFVLVIFFFCCNSYSNSNPHKNEDVKIQNKLKKKLTCDDIAWFLKYTSNYKKNLKASKEKWQAHTASLTLTLKHNMTTDWAVGNQYKLLANNPDNIYMNFLKSLGFDFSNSQEPVIPEIGSIYLQINKMADELIARGLATEDDLIRPSIPIYNKETKHYHYLSWGELIPDSYDIVQGGLNSFDFYQHLTKGVHPLAGLLSPNLSEETSFFEHDLAHFAGMYSPQLPKRIAYQRKFRQIGVELAGKIAADPEVKKHLRFFYNESMVFVNIAKKEELIRDLKLPKEFWQDPKLPKAKVRAALEKLSEKQQEEIINILFSKVDKFFHAYGGAAIDPYSSFRFPNSHFIKKILYGIKQLDTLELSQAIPDELASLITLIIRLSHIEPKTAIENFTLDRVGNLAFKNLCPDNLLDFKLITLPSKAFTEAFCD